MELLNQDFLKQFTDEDGNIDFESANKALASTVQDEYINPTVKKVKSKMVDKVQAQTPQVQDNSEMQAVLDRIAQLEGEINGYKSEQSAQTKRQQLKQELIEKGANEKRVDTLLKYTNIDSLEVDDEMLEMLSQTDGKPKVKTEEDQEEIKDFKEVGNAESLMKKLKLQKKEGK